MIKTKIADLFIKNIDFSDDRYIKITNSEQILNLSDYKDLINYYDFFNQIEKIEVLEYFNKTQIFNNYKQCKLLNTSDKNLEYFEIYEKNNSRGELYFNSIDKTRTLCLTDISSIDSFKSYLACYLNNQLIIVHSNINNKVIFTKINQDEFGNYQKLNFSEINGNYKVISLNVYENDIYLFLCDNITTYIYKISDFSVSLVKTVTQNIIFEEQKYYTLSNNGTPNLFIDTVKLKNSNVSFNYELNYNNYNFNTIEVNEINYNYFSNFIFLKEINEDSSNYFQNYFLSYKNNNNYYIESYIKNVFNESLTTIDYELTDVLEDIFLLNVNINCFILIYRTTNNTTKIFYKTDCFDFPFGELIELTTITEKIKQCSFLRYYDDLIINFTDENFNIHKIIINMSTYSTFENTKLSIKSVIQPQNQNFRYFIKVKN